jgi:hypothetical protein
MSTIQQRDPTVNILARLIVGGRDLAVGQVCQDWLVLREACQINGPCDAQLIVTVNGVDKVHEIFLPHGISPGSDVIDFF